MPRWIPPQAREDRISLTRSQIYETQLSELGTQTEALTTDVTAKDKLLQEARAIANNKVPGKSKRFEV